MLTRRSTQTAGEEDGTSWLVPKSHLTQSPLGLGAQLAKEILRVITPPVFQRKPQVAGVFSSLNGALVVRRVLIEGLQRQQPLACPRSWTGSRR